MAKSLPPAVIVGFGDIGRRVAQAWHAQGGAVTALVRSLRETAPARPVLGDLDDPRSLDGLVPAGAVVFHFAPPSPQGAVDRRTAHLLAALAEVTLRRMVYISTSAVYGDCAGAWIDEDHPVHPRHDRARRRLDAEQRLSDFAARRAIPLVILRVPAIYGPHRLPLERIRRGEPVVCPAQAPWSNRIHVDDLVTIAVRAASDDVAPGIYHASDDEPSSMTDYIYRVADAAGLPRPPCISLARARRTFAPGLLEYLDESRRLDNRRIKTVLGISLRYPTLAEGLANLSLGDPGQGN